ncbi:MAG: response regulator [Eubacteriales bacterium]|nr:response regulator [Eubacteriales bacterium]
MSLKVVIVEDNPTTVLSLVKTIDWDVMKCEVAGTAGDGESGGVMIRQLKPDIVLTDIRMPVKSGLDMIADVREDVPDCRFVIITGYDEFQYASQAIKLGVFDYLLKPIDNEEVMRTVRRAAAVTRRQMENDVVLEQAENLKMRAQLLTLLTNDSQRGQGVHELLAGAGLQFHTYYIMALQQTEERYFSQAVLNRVEAVLARRRMRTVTLLLYDLAVIFVPRGDDGKGWHEEATELAYDLFDELVNPVRIGVSGLGQSSHAIRQAYLQARRALWEAALRKGNRACVFYEDQGDGPVGQEHIADTQRQIDELIARAELTDGFAAEAARALAEQSGRQYSNLRAMMFLYTTGLRRRFGLSADEELDAVMSGIWFVSTEEDVRLCLKELNEAFLRRMDMPKQSLLTRNALQYINLHAIEGIQLNDVADKLCVSANYLSALIRKETGVTFHEHMLEARMNVARSMLADPRILVEEVARAVGYGNYISFYNAFKRIEHMTPTEYRNRKAKL